MTSASLPSLPSLPTLPKVGRTTGGETTIPMDVVFNFDGATGLITAAKMNTGTHGANWGTWTTPEGVPNHTSLEDHDVLLPFNFSAGGTDYNGSTALGLTFDFSTEPVGADTLHFGLTETVTSCQLMYLARYQTVLDGVDPVSYNCDLWQIAGANFTVPQRQHTFSNSKFFTAHTSGDLGASIQDDEGWVVVSVYHDAAGGFAYLIVQQVEQSGDDWVLGDILGTSTGTLSAAGEVIYIRLQDYLRPASGTGTIKVKIAALRNSVLDWPPYNLGTIPAPGSVTATQEAVDSITLTWTNVCDTFHIERKIGSGEYSTLVAEYENNGTDSYTDTGLTEGLTYTYRVTTIIGTQSSGAVESNAETIDNTPFEGGDFVLAQNLGANTDVDTQRGFKFTVGDDPITITHVGLWILGAAGGQFSATIPVFIYDIDGVEITSNDVPTTGATGEYAFVAVPVGPINLSANTSYFCMTGPLGFNTIKNSATLATSIAPVATIDDSAFGSAPTFELDGAGANHLYGPVNFRWEYT